MKTFLSFVSLFLVPSFSIASIDGNSWSLNKGQKHEKFIGGKSPRALEADVFSEVVPFQERWKLVAKVAGLKRPKAAERFLVRCLESNKWFLQSAALKLLQKRKPETALFYANKLLNHSNALVVRSEAVEVISALGGPNHTKVLWNALKQQKNFIGAQSLWIRPQIARTIFKLERSNHSAKEWKFLLRDSDKKIQEMAKRVTRSL